MADNAAKIAEIEAILNAGATSVTSDGTTVNYDFDQLRKQLRQLRASDNTQHMRRPVCATIKISGI